MRRVRQFADRVGRQVFMGEFGAYEAAPSNDRQEYMRAVTAEAEAAGIGWCAWNFTSTFPLFNDRSKRWIPGQLEALGLVAN